MTELSILIITALSAVSFLAGLIDSIAGGGGLLLLPSLLLAGLPPHFVLGTNKFAAIIGTSAAMLNFIKFKKVAWRIASIGIVFSLLGSFLGSRTILIFQNETAGRIIVFLLPLAMAVTLIPKKKKTPENEMPSLSEIEVRGSYIIIPTVCFVLGFYDGFFGPGTGSFLILAFYLFLNMDLVRASGTAKIFNFASNLGAVLVFLHGGKVIFSLGLPLAAANLLGNLAGSTLAIKKGSRLVQAFLLISLSLLFISLIWKYFIVS